MPKLTLVRGIPGTGKSTYSKKLNVFHIESDQYHMRGGVYNYDVNQIKASHTFCLSLFTQAILAGIDVVVSNNFIDLKSMDSYLSLAKSHSYTIEVIKCEGTFESIHNVPKSVISNMSERFEDYEGEIIVNKYPEDKEFMGEELNG